MIQAYAIRSRRRRRRGISLIELVMVTVIVGILASLAVPSFHLALEQSRANVAGANLRAIWSAQRLYWLENRVYAPDLATLYSLDLLDGGIAAQTYYTYEIGSSDASTFVAHAVRTANGGWNGTFNIDQAGTATGALSSAGEPDITPSF